MPIYEYKCGKCVTEFELLVMGSEKPACPTCHKTDIEKLLSVSSSPAVRSESLPVSGGGQACGMPRCCGGGCN